MKEADNYIYNYEAKSMMTEQRTMGGMQDSGHTRERKGMCEGRSQKLEVEQVRMRREK